MYNKVGFLVDLYFIFGKVVIYSLLYDCSVIKSNLNMKGEKIDRWKKMLFKCLIFMLIVVGIFFIGVCGVCVCVGGCYYFYDKN